MNYSNQESLQLAVDELLQSGIATIGSGWMTPIRNHYKAVDELLQPITGQPITGLQPNK